MDRDPAARGRRSLGDTLHTRVGVGLHLCCPMFTAVRPKRGTVPACAGTRPPLKRGLVATDTVHGVSTPPPIPELATDDAVQPSQQHEHTHEDRDLVDISAVEVISRAAVMLMSAAAEQLGLASDDPADPSHRDLDEARTLITALAGLLQAALPDLGPHAAAFRDGLQALQGAFRDYSIVPDEPGTGPGETPRRPPAAL